MLQYLHIENFAIIEKLELDFQQGLTVVTGETGAGKSIIMDALGMVLGDRADSSVVPPGSNKAIIIAAFAIHNEPAIASWLDDNELFDEETCLIKRTLTADGRSKAFINGQPVTLSMLKQLAELLIDIHGQHAHHALLRPMQQLKLLDQYADHQILVKKVSQLFQQFQQLDSKLSALKMATQGRIDRKNLLQYQLQELEAFAFSKEEADNIEEEHQRLSHAEELRQITLRQLCLLNGDDGSGNFSASSVNQMLETTIAELAGALKLDSKLQLIVEQLQSAVIEVSEAAQELAQYAEKLELNPERLFQIEARLSTWHDLARKHHIEPAQLIQHHQALTAEYEMLHADEENLTQLTEQTSQARIQYFVEAKKLGQSRTQAARQLEQKVTAQLNLLGMKESLLEVRFALHPEKLSAQGLEKIDLFIQPNPGLPAQPLSKIASGGELSRISLAIQVVTMSRGTIPVMVFDEVDVGIGGATAEIVGKLLGQLARSAQILCITHQPQVAAQGDQHLLVRKYIVQGKTKTTLDKLDDEARVAEIARMLGGVDITSTTRNHAKEMLHNLNP